MTQKAPVAATPPPPPGSPDEVFRAWLIWRQFDTPSTRERVRAMGKELDWPPEKAAAFVDFFSAGGVP